MKGATTMDGVSWIKLQTNMFDNRKIKQIEELPDGDSILVIWLKLLLLAGTTNCNGCMYFTEDIPYTDQMLAVEFRKPLTTIQYALSTFIKFHMIEIVDDIIMVSNWKHYQNESGLSEIREYNRIKKQESREKQKRLMAEKESTKEKDNNVIDIDKDKDIDKEEVNDMSMTVNDIKKKSTNFNDIFSSFLIDGELREAFDDFIAMRKAKKRPLTARALKMVINRLFELSKDKKTQISIINQSILHNWDTVYELKDNYGKVGATGVQLADVRDSILDDIF